MPHKIKSCKHTRNSNLQITPDELWVRCHHSNPWRTKNPNWNNRSWKSNFKNGTKHKHHSKSKPGISSRCSWLQNKARSRITGKVTAEDPGLSEGLVSIQSPPPPEDTDCCDNHHDNKWKDAYHQSNLVVPVSRTEVLCIGRESIKGQKLCFSFKAKTCLK